MHTSRPTRWTLPALLVTALLVPLGLGARSGDDDDTPCEETAEALRTASLHEARDEFWIGFANCLNLEDRAEAQACFRENERALREAVALVEDQLEAREDLCELLGGGRYDPEVEPRDFVRGVTHPFFPLRPGTTKVFEKETDEGLERVVVTTTRDTRTILGVECTVVRDTVTLEGELVEDTLDYFAQDEHGNVWYFGELAMNFEDGLLHDLDGSWLAGEDGAKPGIVMEAVPAVGDVYRQEFLVNEAEDAARVTALGVEVRVPFGNFTGCIETLDFTPVEPGVFEAKSYAPGVGLVLSVNLETGEREELVAVY